MSTKIKAESIYRIYKVRNVEGDNSHITNHNGHEGLLALDNVNLEIKQGEFVALVGPSGCGKSTFLDILGGLATPNSGDIYIDGKPVKGPGLDRGIVFQGYALFPWRTIQHNIEFGLEIKGIPKNERKDIALKYLKLVGLEGFENRYPYELSGGMKQRVAIARALAFDPEILLMDEPFGALDAQTREVLQIELLRIWEETHKTIVFVTHSIDEAIFLADRVVIMTARPGKIKSDIRIDLPRPRLEGDLKSSPEFARYRHELWELLRDEVDKAEEQASENIRGAAAHQEEKPAAAWQPQKQSAV
ncbi:MAG: ABC transporter ATP-binding protein [Clostridia bacterium]|nr:ABC transporter ATP-binding protein [Clostridia bacterium]